MLLSNTTLSNIVPIYTKFWTASIVTKLRWALKLNYIVPEMFPRSFVSLAE